MGAFAWGLLVRCSGYHFRLMVQAGEKIFIQAIFDECTFGFDRFLTNLSRHGDLDFIDAVGCSFCYRVMASLAEEIV
ncbi:hypothetical protein C5Y96_06240 [Blastopirellula marina]|uniref:Uncharacterized protein n=2 Tax=Pirellulales TaxID=2691354 RepID=A0A2S8FX79_9BACT|nr:hypothetical protein C5Y96_06240 [Blastopirellula marina]RCS53478.1 hypothetical protein DTL36_06250 [Bremerella cremea]